MFLIKKGVRLGRAGAITAIFQVVNSVFRAHGYDTVLTSSLEGKHTRASYHYKGEAFDFRVRFIPTTDERERIEKEVQDNLGEDFQVILESAPDHLHVGWKPLKPLAD